MKCEKCGHEYFLMKTCPHCGNNADGETSDEAKSVIPERTYNMLWYKILKVLLGIGALIDFSQAVMVFVGNSYETWTDAIYAAAPGIKAFDIFCGFVMIGMAILKIFTVLELSEYRARGPKLLLISYGINAVFPLVELFSLNAIIGKVENKMIINGFQRFYLDNLLQPVQTFFVVAIMVLLAIVNYKYFQKREDLFIK
jgi:hypothetical protein